jgi:hypothetical protein
MAYSTTMSKNSVIVKTVTDEKFVEIYATNMDTVQLSNDKRSVMNIIPWVSACAIGVHSYSSGIHRIRARVTKWFPPLLGIRSRSMLPPILKPFGKDSYNHTDGTYGWEGYVRYLDGWSRVSENWDKRNRVGHIWAITLNCDQHRLHIIDEDTKEEDEMEVDVSKAPLPWCLFIGLSIHNAGISLI